MLTGRAPPAASPRARRRFNEKSIGAFELALSCTATGRAAASGAANGHSEPAGPSLLANGSVGSGSCDAVQSAEPAEASLPPACLHAPALHLGSQLSGDLSATTAQEGGGGNPGQSLYRLAPPVGPAGAAGHGAGGGGSTSMAVVSTCGSEADTEVQLFRGCPDLGGHLVGSSDDECGLGGFVEAAIAFPHRPPPVHANAHGAHAAAAAAGAPAANDAMAADYYVRVVGHAGVRGRFTLSARGEHISCTHAPAIELGRPHAHAGAGHARAGGGQPAARTAWQAAVSLCAGRATPHGRAGAGARARAGAAQAAPPSEAAASAVLPADMVGAAGPDYAPGAAHLSYSLRLSESTLLALDACGAPQGTRLELFGGCAGAPDEMPLGVADGSDGACLEAAQAAGAASADGGGGAVPTGARLVTSVRPGLYTVVVSGARVRADDLCAPFVLSANATAAPTRSWSAALTAEGGLAAAAAADAAEGAGAFGGAGCASHEDCAGLASASGRALFCADGLCESCERCATCADGIDNTCGECDSALFPSREKGCERWTLAASVLRQDVRPPAAHGAPARGGAFGNAWARSAALVGLAALCALGLLALAARSLTPRRTTAGVNGAGGAGSASTAGDAGAGAAML